jgi:prepilin-type N-terminal cleavage/methylation domain-containing protein
MSLLSDKGLFIPYCARPAPGHSSNPKGFRESRTLITPSFPFSLRGMKGDCRTSRNDRRTLWQSGFTLLEVLIAVAILSVILASIYSTFFLSHRAMEGMDESLTKLQEARRAIDILRCELEATYQSEQDTNTFFRIEDRDVYGKQTTQLVFTTFSTLRPGLSKISYYVEEKEGKLSLFKRVESPYSKEEPGGVDIIEDLDGFTIEAKYNDTWVRTWDAAVNKAKPEELRIGLTMVVKGHTITLSDIAKPRIGNQG